MERVQILGNHLATAMEELKVDAELKYTTPTTGKFERAPKFEVWEMSQETFEAFNQVDDDDWKDDYGWWRYGERLEQNPSTLFLVNKQEMLGFEGRDEEDIKEADGSESDGPEWYLHFLEYLDLNQGMSTEKNVTITAISLAKANGLTLAEFMEKYYGEGIIAETKQTKVISGFPGVGKSTLTKNDPSKTMLDSDSSQYSWIEPGVRHPDFPNNYMERIKANIGKVDYIFVSSHDVVRDALAANDIKYTLVYPGKELKEEYIQRYVDRGNNEGFVKLLQEKYEDFIEGIEKEVFPKLVPLKTGQYLSDVVDSI